MKTTTMLGIVAVFGLSAQLAAAVSPTPDEMREARRWVAAKFEGVQDARQPSVGLRVWANHGPVTRNGRGGKPLVIGDKQYTRGLYCHAVSKVVVRLPGPGKTFSAVAGVDSNEQTRTGRGSVVFSVTVGDKRVFRSELMREGMPGVPVQADLGGAQEVVLEVSDGGDGISCDQADWADAQAVLADGSTVWLGDLPIVGTEIIPYTTEPFFSFTYDGKPSSALLDTWQLQRASKPLDVRRTERTLSYTDPKTGLVIRCVGIEYRDFPAVEWTLCLKNTGDKNTPILANIESLDTRFQKQSEGEFLLHGRAGDNCSPISYQPFDVTLGPNAVQEYAPVGGRPTNGAFPYYNVQMSAGGVMMAIGWPGQWASAFRRDGQDGLRITAGQQQTHLYLKPGEEIRTPLMVLFFWKGDDVVRAQNLWRRWMLAHNVPKPGGKPLLPIAAECCENFYDFHNGLPEMRQAVEAYTKAGVKLDYCWRDAGWYACDGWWRTGTWEPDPKRFPQGFKPFSDWLHARGLKFIVWFEPERTTPDTWLTKNHPEWIHGGKNGGLLNLGNPDAWKWLVNHIDQLLTEQGIDLYRQDFNMDPLDSWRGADSPDRQGITENKHVVGYLAYWDELRRRHPGMLIDSCASGGRRNDLETLRRAVPLLRSDYQGGPETALGNQGHTYGLSSWVPYYGSGVYATDTYSVRSYYMPCFGVAADARQNADWPAVARAYRECRQVAADMLGDYYPLTPYSLQDDQWIAWQFDRPEQGEGTIQAFRREKSLYESIRVQLHGLDPNAVYTLGNFDVAGSTEMSGRQLLDHGLSIVIGDRRGSAIITYKKKP